MFEQLLTAEQKEYINIDSGLARIRGNKVIYKKMLMLFLQSEEFNALEQALTEQNLPKAADVAHAIKGITGNLSLPLLFGISTKILGQLREGEVSQTDIAEYRIILKETRQLVEKVAENID